MKTFLPAVRVIAIADQLSAAVKSGVTDAVLTRMVVQWVGSQWVYTSGERSQGAYEDIVEQLALFLACQGVPVDEGDGGSEVTGEAMALAMIRAVAESGFERARELWGLVSTGASSVAIDRQARGEGMVGTLVYLARRVNVA